MRVTIQIGSEEGPSRSGQLWTGSTVSTFVASSHIVMLSIYLWSI